MKQPLWVKILFSWPALAVWDAALIITCWPVANHWLSYGWILVTIAVLLWEAGCKLFAPTHQTASNITQDLAVTQRIRHFLIIFFWTGFALTLAVHFCLRGM